MKLIRQDFSEDHTLTERFRTEAKAAAALAHRNVVTVHDFGIERRNGLYGELKSLLGPAALR